MKPQKVLILHGWQANANLSWFPKAKEHLFAKGYQVFVPDLPGGYFPILEDWLEIVRSYNLDENWIVIGHSLGGVTILRFLEETKKPIAQAIVVASPLEAMNFGALENFYQTDFNWKKIKSNAESIDLIYESDDPVVPIANGEKLAKVLEAELYIQSGALHLIELDLSLLDKIIKE